MSTDVQKVVQELIANPAVTVVLASGIKDGDRVAVRSGDVEAFGTIGIRAYGWEREFGANNLPVVLDGTDQRVVVHASMVTPI